MGKAKKKPREGIRVVTTALISGLKESATVPADAFRRRDAAAEEAEPYWPAAMPAMSVGKFHAADWSGLLGIDSICKRYGLSRAQLAETAGLPPATISKSARRSGLKAQSRLIEMMEILGRVEEWAGGKAQAMAWYRSQPIPALDGRTAEALVKDRRAVAVRDYLDHLALGGFA